MLTRLAFAILFIASVASAVIALPILGHIPSAPAWTPLSKSGNAWWYDANNSGSITQSSGLVSQWNDLGPNSYTQTASGGNRPTYTTNQINSKSAIVFGSGNALSAGSVSPLGNGTTAWCLSTIAETGNAAIYPAILAFPSTLQFAFNMFYSTDPSYGGLWWGSVPNTSWGTNGVDYTISNGTYYTVVLNYDGSGSFGTTDYAVYINGISQTVLNKASNFDTTTNFVLGALNASGTEPLGGGLAETFAWLGSQCDSTDLTNISNYYLAKYGIL